MPPTALAQPGNDQTINGGNLLLSGNGGGTFTNSARSKGERRYAAVRRAPSHFFGHGRAALRRSPATTPRARERSSRGARPRGRDGAHFGAASTRACPRRPRVELLETARRAARDGVEMHVVVTVSRATSAVWRFDTPRRWLRLARLPVAEPGDCFGPVGYAHCFFGRGALAR